MTSSVLFDDPGPKTRARHRLYTIASIVALIGVIAAVVWRMYDKGQLEYELWEPFVTPKYVNALAEGLLDTLQMAALSVLFAVVFGVVFGIGKLSNHRW